MNEHIEERNERGFTLIELLIAIVVVGILAAVAIVGIGGLTNTGSTSACKASADSAVAASAAYYANNSTSATPWPADLGFGGRVPGGVDDTERRRAYRRNHDGRGLDAPPGERRRNPTDVQLHHAIAKHTRFPGWHSPPRDNVA